MAKQWPGASSMPGLRDRKFGPVSVFHRELERT